MSALAGTGTLARFMLRRDRVIAPLALLVAAGVVVLTASSFERLYPTVADRARFAAAIEGNGTFLALYGHGRALESIGGLTAWRTGATVAVVAGLVSLLLVVRHTRAEEEPGRTELVRAAAVGRLAPLAAALAVAAALAAAIAAAIALGLVAQGLPAAGSLAMGLAIGATGLVFAGVGAVAAQLTESARAARGTAGGLLAAAYAVRAVGDSGPGALSWLSPVHWGTAAMRPFAGERWWPLLLFLAAFALLAGAAVALLERRDLGAGMLRARPGPAAAGPGLRGAFGLALRLQRGALVGWSAGLLACGVVIGSIASGVADLLDTSPSIADLLTQAGGASVTDAFLSSLLPFMGLIATGYTVSSALRMHAEEAAGQMELVLATPLGRLRWAAAHAVMALAGSAIVLLAGGIGAGAAYAVASGDPAQLPRLAGAALAQLPALWVVGAVAVALFGLLPRAVAGAWAALAACVLLWFAGPLLDVPSWVLDVSPYEHVPAVPAAALVAGPLLALTAVAAALLAVGLGGFRRRDAA